MKEEINKALVPGILAALEHGKGALEHLEGRISILEDQGIPGLRDFFATSALSCLARIDIHSHYDVAGVADYCYRIADAMLKEREKT